MKNKGFHLQQSWFLGTKNKVFDGFGCSRFGVIKSSPQLMLCLVGFVLVANPKKHLWKVLGLFINSN